MADANSNYLSAWLTVEEEPIAAVTQEEIDKLLSEIVIPPIGGEECRIKREKKPDENKTKKGSSLAADIREVTQTILKETDCVALQQKIKTALDGLKEDIIGSNEEVKKKLEEISPVLSLPLNPFAIPKWLKKFALGRILPDYEATIDLIIRITEVINALNDLVKVVDELKPRLEACAISTRDMIKRDIENQIDDAVDQVKRQIEKAIADAICEAANDAGITANDVDDILTGISAIKNAVDSFDTFKNTVETALQGSLNKVGQNQAQIQSITGIPPVINTSSLDAFTETANSPEFAQYKEQVQAVLQTPDPVSQTAPVVTGSTAIGSLLACSNGTWTANGVVTNYPLSFQWMRQNVEIYGANTFQYTTTNFDSGQEVYCRVRAESQLGIAEAISNAILVAGAGYMGSVGPQGAQGAAGAQGPAGPQGLAGAQGPTGVQGPNGAQGPNGPQGPTGSQGPTGVQGPIGAQGVTGAQGPTGSQGPIGAQGPAGTQGPQGPTGVVSSNITGGLTFDNIVFKNTATLSTSSATQVSLVEFPTATYRSGSFLIQAVSGLAAHLSRVTMTSNTSTAIATEYETLITESSLFTVEVDIFNANTRIRVTPASASPTTFKSSYELITT
jgi:hypothetical protein